MRCIERHERERYRILCALRAMHDRLARARSPEPAILEAFVELLHGCVLEDFFPHEEAFVDRWERLAEVPASESALAPLAHAHRVTRDQIAELALRLRERREDPERLRIRVDRVVVQITSSLVRGQDVVDGVERSVEERADPGLARQLARTMPRPSERDDLEKRLSELLEKIRAGSDEDPPPRPGPGTGGAQSPGRRGPKRP